MGRWWTREDSEDESEQDCPNWGSRRDSLIDSLRTSGRVNDPALEALRAVPRHEFVPEGQRKGAYADRPLPIGEGQTISAPHMVAIMVDRLDLQAGQKVLEIGTGCGYHAAVTAEVVGSENVYSVEYHQTLAERARRTLEELGYSDITITVGDGHQGWPEHAPYDRAYLTAAGNSVPDPILEQLRPNGIFLGPIGTGYQTLVRVKKHPDGSTEREDFGGVRFVQMQES